MATTAKKIVDKTTGKSSTANGSSQKSGVQNLKASIKPGLSANKTIVPKNASQKTSAKKVISKSSQDKKAQPLTRKPAPAKKAAVAKQVTGAKKTNLSKALPVSKKTKNIKTTELKKPVKTASVKVAPQPASKAKEDKSAAAKPLVLPKMNTKNAKPYNPDFTKSVLDPAAQGNNGPSMRYSDAELNEFRELIQRKLDTAKKELGYLQGLITRKDEMGGDETDNRYMTMEDGSLSMEREQLSQMASRQITFIDHLEKATMRIENKTYGICRVTGKLIDKARLRAVPHATLSMEAKMGNVK